MSNLGKIAKILRGYKFKNDVRRILGVQIAKNGAIIEITEKDVQPYIEFINKHYMEIVDKGWTLEFEREFLKEYGRFFPGVFLIALERFKGIECKIDYEIEVYTADELKKAGILPHEKKREVLEAGKL